MALEINRKKLELSRVKLAREELEFKIEERNEEIKRLLEHIEIQKKREAELEIELKGKE
jgi:hypothetical protein